MNSNKHKMSLVMIMDTEAKQIVAGKGGLSGIRKNTGRRWLDVGFGV